MRLVNMKFSTEWSWRIVRRLNCLLHHTHEPGCLHAGLTTRELLFAPRLPPGSCPWTLLEDFHPSDPLIAHPWKKSCRRPCKTPLYLRPRFQLWSVHA